MATKNSFKTEWDELIDFIDRTSLSDQQKLQYRGFIEFLKSFPIPDAIKKLLVTGLKAFNLGVLQGLSEKDTKK